MSEQTMPNLMERLVAEGCVKTPDILKTTDGFFLVCRSLAHLLLAKGIEDFPDSKGQRRRCDRFFDDWFLFAVSGEGGETCGLLKLREQERDAESGAPADGDTPGVTVSFVSLNGAVLADCLADPCDENRKRLNAEINRVVAYRGQRHHRALKRYFAAPQSQGPYLVANAYVKQIASYAQNGRLAVPDCYRALLQRKHAGRIPLFIDALNREAGRVVCDGESIFLQNAEAPTAAEAAAILATHTGNTSCCSFAAEVEYHARFLVLPAKVRIPFLGRSLYDSAIRADMTVEDAAVRAPFYRETSKLVKRQRKLHQNNKMNLF